MDKNLLSQLLQAMEVDDEPDFYDEKSEEVAEYYSKKRKNRNKTVKKVEKLPDCGYNVHGNLSIQYEKHSIEYKEQNWVIPERSVEYLVRMVYDIELAKSIAKNCKCSQEDIEKTEKGNIRWALVESAEEAIPMGLKTLAYVGITKQKNSLDGRIYFNKDAFKYDYADARYIKDKVTRQINKILSRAIT